jgi:hypothetical protein
MAYFVFWKVLFFKLKSAKIIMVICAKQDGYLYHYDFDRFNEDNTNFVAFIFSCLLIAFSNTIPPSFHNLIHEKELQLNWV